MSSSNSSNQLRCIYLYPKKKEHSKVILPGIQSFHYTYGCQGEEILVVRYAQGKTESYPLSNYDLIKVCY